MMVSFVDFGRMQPDKLRWGLFRGGNAAPTGRRKTRAASV
jgi:hypothetical protein